MKIYIYLFSVFFLLGVFLPFCTVSAQEESQILSVTPPLFQLSAAPGDVWSSAIKVVNGNRYELSVYAEVVIFVPEGEHGQGKFYPLDEREHGSSTFATWIDISKGPHIIPPERSLEIPLVVKLPQDAPPGGHFAAILISTEPPKGEGQLLLKTSQVVTSLFFARIDGDIVESADIREFRIKDRFVEEPVVDFILRFQNKGNVYVQPRGNIVITNMWGKERGVIPINNQTNYGNVLPNTIREFNFSWKGEGGITEIGRHKAIVTLGYGEDGVKSTSGVAYFWVLPLKATLITLSIVGAFVLFVVWAIRLYVRRMLTLAGVDPYGRSLREVQPQSITRDADVQLSAYKKVSAPITLGARDLRERLSHVDQFVDVISTLFEFVRQYKLFFISVLVLAGGFVGAVLFIADATDERRNYEVTFKREGEEVIVNSEEILKESLSNTASQVEDNDQTFSLVIVNESGEPGRGAEVAVLFENAGYVVDSLQLSETTRDVHHIIYDPGLVDSVLTLQEVLGESTMTLNETFDESSASSTITIYVGKN